jgi:hypothetical protein
MKQDEYGAAIERALQEASEPLSASELRAAVGCSRQRVYAWLQANEHRVRLAGKDRAGAALYIWRAGPAGGWPAGEGEAGAGGPVLRVTSFFQEAGEVVLVVTGPDGALYHARPA